MSEAFDYGNVFHQVEAHMIADYTGEKDADALADAIRYTAIPTLLVFADDNAGVREAISTLRAILAEQEP